MKIKFRCLISVFIPLITCTNVFAAEIVMPDIGKFRNCRFTNQCVNTFDCSIAKRCDHIQPFVENCKQNWRTIKLGLGIKTKVPEIKCSQIKNEELKKCNSEKSLAISQCKERQLRDTEACRNNAEIQSRQCQEIKNVEIETAKELDNSLRSTIEYLSSLNSETISFDFPKSSSFGEVSTQIKVIKSKDFSGVFSFFYSEKQYADWEKIPSLGYSNYRSFAAIGNYLILSPDISEEPSEEMVAYTAIISVITNKFGLDGLAQLYTHKHGELEEILLSELNKSIQSTAEAATD